MHIAFVLLMTVISVALIGFGVELFSLDGSGYYLFAGITLGCITLMIIRRSRVCVVGYGIFFAITCIWAIWESGLDGWALAPRIAMFAAIGLWMLTPMFRRRLGIEPWFSWARYFWPGLASIVFLFTVGLFLNDSVSDIGDGTVRYDLAFGLEEKEWRHYGKTQGGSRFSPLTQVTPDNVGGLETAWIYHTGPAPESATGRKPSFQVTPLKIGELLYICTGYNDVIALDAENGQEVWRHSPDVNDKGVMIRTCRGLAQYRVPGASGFCSHRIYTATIDSRLIALDSRNGKPCPEFGKFGEVDLLAHMGEVEKGYYFSTSPPTIVRGRLILGGWVTDGQSVGEPSGVIRAFDAASGEFSWAFDSGRPDRQGLPPEGQSFTRGSPNSWAPMSADEDLGIVYVPTGNATPDYFGGHRTENDDKFSSSVIALDAETGKVRWSFQTTHHDVWDYDVASQPVLIDLPDGTRGLLQPTKRGEVFFLDRETGTPIAEVKELPVPQAKIPGDWLSPTQPFSVGMPSFEGPKPSEQDMWGITPIDQAYCRILYQRARFEGTFTPIQHDRPTIVWPGYLGGINWGSVSVDPGRQIMVVNSTHIANYNQLIERSEADKLGVAPMSADNPRFSSISAQAGTPFASRVFPFLSPIGVPCQEPPYGLISAVDLNSRSLLWQKEIGTSRDSGPFLLPTVLPIPMGVPNLGGTVTTESGLIFIGATQEHMFRAFDISSGRELWKVRLPAGAQSTPAVYWSEKSNRQMVVVAAGGHPAFGSGYSDTLIAFALPKQSAASIEE